MKHAGIELLLHSRGASEELCLPCRNASLCLGCNAAGLHRQQRALACNVLAAGDAEHATAAMQWSLTRDQQVSAGLAVHLHSAALQVKLIALGLECPAPGGDPLACKEGEA